MVMPLPNSLSLFLRSPDTQWLFRWFEGSNQLVYSKDIIIIPETDKNFFLYKISTPPSSHINGQKLDNKKEADFILSMS